MPTQDPNEGPSKDQDRHPDERRGRSGKSVRWTGQDYFSYSGASGNRSRSSAHLNASDESSESSSEDDSDDDDNDEQSAIVRAATRANTWFNRLRQQSDNSQSHSNEEGEPLEDSSHGSQGERLIPRNSDLSTERDADTIPAIHISEHPEINPFSQILDIGTQVSGGLAPGSAVHQDNDPIDREYREHRNRLLASIGSHSQPTSPQFEPVELQSTDIPLQDLPPAPYTPNASSPSYEYHDDSFDQGDSSKDSTESPAAYTALDGTARDAEILRQKLRSSQSERSHKLEEVIAERKRRESFTSNRSSRSFRRKHHHRSDSDNASTSTSSTQAKTRKEEEEEELRRLEEVARQEAEEHAKHLVKSHLATNLLKPNSNNDGYVDNPRFLFDADRLDEDVVADEEDEGPESTEKTSHHLGGDKNEDTTVAGDSLDKKSELVKASDSQNTGSDSDSDNEEDRREVSLRGDPDYIPPPKKVKEGVLGSLLRLYAGQEDDDKSMSSLATSPNPSPGATPISTPLPSPSLTLSGTPTEYTPSERPESSAETYVSASSHKSRWKRPSLKQTHSSEDVLGREKKGRPKWYHRNSSLVAPSLGQLASSGLSVAGGAASNMASAAVHTQNISRKMGKSLHIDHDSHRKFDKGEKSDESHARAKEARKLAKLAEQKRREKEKQIREKNKALKKARLAEQARITVHIADVLQRQRFLLRLGRALMLFGAPSHRLEDYLKSTARVLEIDAQVLYIPGCILVSFGDATTHTSETRLIRVTQGLNLAKLHATHLIFKEVVHDLMSLEEASSHIDQLLRSKNIYPWWLVVFFYGIACACCGMFAYGAFWRDIPLIFLIGGGVGFLQFWVQPKSDLYANVFEVSSSIIVSFTGRAFGSIGNPKDYVFCFASIVQASLALILPGYIILVGALELQTKNLVAGSVRMFYANIYSMFLSFGITLGSAIFGWIYNDAVTDTTCQHTADVDAKWKILFVPAATLFMALVNQAGYRQLPVMVIIGSAGYAVQYFVAANVKATAFTSAIGAFTMGVIGNLYSRVGHGLAFAAMLPGIFVLVPSGVAAQGSLVAGVKVATEIVNSSKSSSSSTDTSSQTISQLGNSMTQVAVGIAVGLFAATLVVYPIGFKRKRSGLFTF
nr:Prm10 [Starmerella bombicola]